METATSIDLHLHTTRSDGRYDAETVIRKITAAGVKTAAITDHDTLLGFRDGRAAAASAGILLIPGLELSTTFSHGGKFVEEVHVLWYGMNPESDAVQLFEREIREAQNFRIAKSVDKLKAKGYALEFGGMLNAAGAAPVCVVQVVMQLIERGFLKLEIEAIRNFVDEYMAPGGVAYEPPFLETAEAMNRAKAAGGLLVVAHPAKVKSEAALSTMIEMADGIEAFYAAHSAGERNAYAAKAAQRGLYVTCGSDFHGYYEALYAPPVLSKEEMAALSDFLAKSASKSNA